MRSTGCRAPDRLRGAGDLHRHLPRPGLRENVGELDFASMYPSLMDRYNISPETVNCGCCDPGMPVPGIGAHTCTRRRGISSVLSHAGW